MSELLRKCRLFFQSIKYIGFINSIFFLFQRISKRFTRSTEVVRLYTKSLSHPLWCRPQASDASLFLHIFVERAYSCINDILDPKLIIDCGANVGYSTVYFLSRFPNAHVIAVEPDPDNFRLLQMNTAIYSDRVRCICSAVWPDSVGLILESSYRDGREWSRSVREPKSGESPDVRTVSIQSIWESVGCQPIDLLKIDVERAEKEIFSRNYEHWIDNVNTLAIELHDDECVTVFNQAIAHIPFTISNIGELTVCKRINPPQLLATTK